MPKRDGYEVAAYVKSRPQLAHIPVVLLTGAFEPIDQARASAAGSSDVLAKPFEPQMVINSVKELLGEQRTSPNSTSRRPRDSRFDPAASAAAGEWRQAVSARHTPQQPARAGHATRVEHDADRPGSLDAYSIIRSIAAFSNRQAGHGRPRADTDSIDCDAVRRRLRAGVAGAARATASAPPGRTHRRRRSATAAGPVDSRSLTRRIGAVPAPTRRSPRRATIWPRRRRTSHHRHNRRRALRR